MEPLAERLRPRTLDDYIGQEHLVGEGAVLRRMIDSGRIASFILWGPPGVGKTTLAQIIANRLETPFYTLSAVTSGVKDVRDVIERAQSGRFFQFGLTDSLYRRNPSFLKVATRFALGCGREGNGDAYWCDNREPILRSDSSVALSLSTLYAEVVGERRFAEAVASSHYGGCGTEEA